VRNPLLTDIEIDWNGLPVHDVVPSRIPDLFSAKPIIVSGRFDAAATGKLRIRGRIGARRYEREIEVKLPAQQKENSAIPAIWARRKIDALGVNENENREAITQLGLSYGLMTTFTSYYAVEERIVNEGGQSRRVEVPVELPEGMRHEGLGRVADSAAMNMVKMAPAAPMIGEFHKAARHELKVEQVRLRIRVMLREASATVLQKLKELGFLADPAALGARFLNGTIEAGKLAELRKLEQVLRVEEIQ
jgi:Ca-activated chloride channel family protein